MKHNPSRLGAFDSSDLFFGLLIAFIIGVFVLVLVVGAHGYDIKRQFYSANGYVEVKYRGMDIWIKKTDIDLINATPTPEK